MDTGKLKVKGLLDASSQGGALILPKGPISSRPAGATGGMIRYNTDLGQIETWAGVAWTNIAAPVVGGPPIYGPITLLDNQAAPVVLNDLSWQIVSNKLFVVVRYRVVRGSNISQGELTITADGNPVNTQITETKTEIGTVGVTWGTNITASVLKLTYATTNTGTNAQAELIESAWQYGPTGASGLSGTSGVSGWSGTSGLSGTGGVSGVSGRSGLSGTSGISGISGTSGLSGASGSSGTSGTMGDSGYSGYSGTLGISGFSGTSGESGFSGVSGLSGSSGVSGLMGESGFSGASGQSGLSGTSGASGFSGVSGLSILGPTGPTGPTGVVPSLTFLDLTDTPATYSSQANKLVAVDGAETGLSFQALPWSMTIACSDETTDLTAGTSKVTFRMPHAITLTSVRGSLSTASSAGVVEVDVNEGGVSVFSTRLTIDANSRSSVGATTPAVLSDTSLADDAEITLDIDQAGTGAKGLKVTLIGTRSL